MNASSQLAGQILDDEDLVETLQMSKTVSVEIRQRVAESEEAERKLNQARQKYLPVRFSSVIDFVRVISSAGPAQPPSKQVVCIAGRDTGCGAVLCSGRFVGDRRNVPVFARVVPEDVRLLHRPSVGTHRSVR